MRQSTAARSRFSALAIASTLAGSLILAPAAHAQWTCISLHPAGNVFSSGYGVGDGQEVGYVQVGPTVGHQRAAVWSGTASSWINLHPTTMGYSIAFAASGGQQAGGYYPAGFSRAALWSGSAASYVDLHPSAALWQSGVTGMRAGQQVGWTIEFVLHAALWNGTPGSWVDLNPPPTGGFDHTSEAYATDGVNQVGYVVGADSITGAALWSGSAASWVNLHPAGMLASWAYGVGDGQQAGVVRVLVDGGAIHAALWTGTAASWVDLHPAGAFNSRASAVAKGMQVGQFSTPSFQHAALWKGTAASLVDLHAFTPAGFITSEARGIWADSTGTYIIGSGYSNLTGREEALLWSGPPACAAPMVTTHPLTQNSCGYSTINLTVAASGSTPFTYQWRKGLVPISAVSNPSAATPTLVLVAPRSADAGSYDCLITNACGLDTSNPATLTVCAADLNCDTVIDILDFLDYVDAFGTCDGLPAPCSSPFGVDADYNADTIVDILDLLDFLNDLGTGCV